VVGGLVSSTALSLFLVPAIFTVLAKREQPRDEANETPAASAPHAVPGTAS